MAQLQVTLTYDKFTAPITNSKRSALGKKGITGGVEVDFSTIPENVLSELLITAVTDYLQAGLKTVDKETATTETCQKAMKKRLEVLKAGATSTEAGPRKAPTKDPVLAAAKAIVKKAIIDSTDEKLDARELNKSITALFKAYKDAAKANKDNTDWEPEGTIALVPGAMAEARRQIEAAESMSGSLVEMAQKAKAAAQKAKAAKAEAAPAADAPKPKAKKPAAKKSSGPSA